jgi:hypothetical protein
MKNLGLLILVLIVTNIGCKSKVNETKISEQKLDYEFLIKNTPTLLFTTGHDLDNKSALVGVSIKIIDSTTMSYIFGKQDWGKERNWKGIAKLVSIESVKITNFQKNVIPALEFQDKEKKIIIRISKNTKLNESIAQIFKNDAGKLVEFSPLLYYK